MRCEAVRNKLDRFRRQELAPRMRDRVEAHLSDCADCRQHLARQERLVVLLATAPELPAVPDGFGDRLMAAASRRRAEQQTIPGSLWRPRWLSPMASIKSKAVQAVAIAGGLLAGILMGQQTWHSAQSSIRPRIVELDAVSVYELDYLTDAPGGSLVQSYLSLTKTPYHNGT